MTSKLQAAMRVIAQHLDEIEGEVFKPGAGMKLTFIARDPNNPEADMLVSEDNIDDIIQVLERSRARETVL